MSSAHRTPDEPTCSACGSALNVGARFCNQCGAPLSRPPAAPAVPPPPFRERMLPGPDSATTIPSSVGPNASSPPASTRSPTAPPGARLPARARIRGKSSVWPFVAGAGALAALCLCVCLLGGLYFRFAPIGTTAGPSTEVKGAFDPEAYQGLEKSVEAIQKACRAGNVDAVMQLTHPAMRPTFQPILSAHQTELKRLADLLSTRTLTAMTNGMAEYQVRENGQTYYVTFEAWSGQWYLSGL